MAERRFGRIINITSASVRAPIAGLDVSSGARAGLTAFLASAARRFAERQRDDQLDPAGDVRNRSRQAVVWRRRRRRGARRAPRGEFPPREPGGRKNSASSARCSPARRRATSSGRTFSSTAAPFRGFFDDDSKGDRRQAASDDGEMTPRAQRTTNSVTSGIALKIAATLAFAVMSALIKAISARFPVAEIVLFRSLGALVVLVIWLGSAGECPRALATRRPSAMSGVRSPAAAA